MDSKAEAGHQADTSEPAALRPLHIFVVENHDDTRYLLGLLLEQLGHSVECASTMEEALHAMPDCHCDMLISDIGLPDGNGWDLLARLGEKRPPYAIAMSGFGMASDRERSVTAGYRHHLLKPVEPAALERLLLEAAAEAAPAR